jgi:hypothetical protein
MKHGRLGKRHTPSTAEVGPLFVFSGFFLAKNLLFFLIKY